MVLVKYVFYADVMPSSCSSSRVGKAWHNYRKHLKVLLCSTCYFVTPFPAQQQSTQCAVQLWARKLERLHFPVCWSLTRMLG